MEKEKEEKYILRRREEAGSTNILKKWWFRVLIIVVAAYTVALLPIWCHQTIAITGTEAHCHSLFEYWHIH